MIEVGNNEQGDARDHHEQDDNFLGGALFSRGSHLHPTFNKDRIVHDDPREEYTTLRQLQDKTMLVHN